MVEPTWFDRGTHVQVDTQEPHYSEVSHELPRCTTSFIAGRTTTSGFTGTPGSVADRMQEWFEAGACDGFMLQTPYLPGGIEDVVHQLVPELQRRAVSKGIRRPTLRLSLGRWR